MPDPKKSRLDASEPTPIVTFYSYKGGVGRSMAVLNVASLIASRGFRVLIIDFDLEAPGLSHLLGKDAIPAKKQVGRKAQASAILRDGVVELLSDAVLRGADSDLLSKPFSQIAGKYTFSYKPPKGLKQHAGASLTIMPSGRLNEEYSTRLDALDLPGLYSESENSGKRLILRLREIIIHSGLYDYILVDSRTGHSDEAGICTRDLADHRMVVSGLNAQNISGTAAFLHNLRIALKRENKPIKTPDIILSPVPNGEDDMVAEREKVARCEFQKAWRDDMEIKLLIPYHPRLALTEEAYVPSITASPLRNAYLEIEERLLHSLGHVPHALDEEFQLSVRKGDGPAALKILRRLTRLLRAPQFPGRVASRNTWFYWGLIYHDNLLKQLLKLNEALEILKLLAESNQGHGETIVLAKKIHKYRSPMSNEFDQFVLKLDNFHLHELGDYASFLADVCNDHDTAEQFFKRAIKADSRHAYTRGNYGQFLIGQGRTTEGLAQLRTAWQHNEASDPANSAELAFALWLGTLLAGDEGAWERIFKSLIQKGFPRHPWNFDAMLAQAAKKLKPADAKYARSLASAFLDKAKVRALDDFPRWKKLQPLDPALVNSDGTIRDPRKP